jgi:hypothetical protein
MKQIGRIGRAWERSIGSRAKVSKSMMSTRTICLYLKIRIVSQSSLTLMMMRSKLEEMLWSRTNSSKRPLLIPQQGLLIILTNFYLKRRRLIQKSLPKRAIFFFRTTLSTSETLRDSQTLRSLNRVRPGSKRRKEKRCFSKL